MISKRKYIRKLIASIIAFSVIWSVIGGLISFHQGLDKGHFKHICVFMLPKKHNESIYAIIDAHNESTLTTFFEDNINYCTPYFSVIEIFNERDFFDVNTLFHSSQSHRGPPQLLSV
ncbi:MAG: hypothetical protein U9R32_09300 [Bacteroidota bacterium]|nr:hypothetical protein [Bacteroidota bacterium]